MAGIEHLCPIKTIVAITVNNYVIYRSSYNSNNSNNIELKTNNTEKIDICCCFNALTSIFCLH